MIVLKRRRREYKTDYAKRIKLLKGGSPRIVFRKTNKYVIGQYIVSKESQDKTSFGFSSKKLIDFGWPKELKNSLKSIPASYLLGFLIGNKIKKEKLKTPIIDFGMSRMVHKTRVYAFLKGLSDAGIGSPNKKDIFPDEEKIKGKFLKEDFTSNFETIKSKIGEL